MEQAKWYVIHTYSGYENKVSHSIENMVENHNLQDLILEVKVPMEKVEEHKDNEVKVVERKVFPGYVLVKMVLNVDTHYMIRSIRGVTGFVGTSTDPVPLTDREVKRLGVETVRSQVDYQVGDTVNITGGPMSGFSGVVNSLNVAENKVTVVVSMFGRETPVELELAQVKKVD